MIGMIQNRLYMLLILAIIIIYSDQSLARDERIKLPIKDALNTEAAKEKLSEGIKFYFGKQKHGTVIKKFGEYGSNKKTNAFNKTDTQSCNWAFLSAVLSLQNRALQEGGNAVINIQSNYKNSKFSSEEKFECGAGNIMAGVALKGTVVKLK